MGFITKEWTVDTAERVVMTFLVTFATAWLAAPTLDVDQAKALALGALVAVGTLLKTLITGVLTGTPSAVPSTTAIAATKT